MKRTILCILTLATLQISNAQNWFQKGTDIDGEAAGDWSGYSVSMPDAKTIAVGALLNEGNGTGSGHVRIYSWSNGSWIQKGADLNGLNTNDWYGRSVSMPDSNTIAIGAPSDGGNVFGGGHTQIFKWNGNAWIQKGLDIEAEAFFDQAGFAVSMPDSNTVAIGAINNSGNSFSTGHVRIYKWNGSAWIQKGIDIDGEADADQTGYFVSMPDSNTVAIGSPFNDGNGFDAGQVRVYTWDGTDWLQKGTDIEGEGVEDWLGLSVSMPDANTIAVGAPNNDNNGTDAGQIRIYKWDGSSWMQKGTSIYGLAPADQSGYSVNMPDSNTVAIDSHGNDENGTDAGQVRVFNWNGSNWIQKGINLNGEAANDVSGLSLCMADSVTLAIGGPWNDENGSSAGHVRTYIFCSITTNTITPTACNSYVSPSGSYTWTSSGTYSDVIPNKAGCDSIITINLTITNSTLSTITQTACNNYISPSGNYNWTSSGIYLDTITNNAGCDSIITINLTINSVADLNTSTNDLTITANNVNAIYQWLDCANGYITISGAVNQSYTASMNGSYAVELTENGCVDTSACVIINTVGITQNKENIKYSLSPNPTSGQFSITTESIIDNTLVIMRNLLGQEILHKNYSPTKRIEMNIEGPSGVYILEIVSGDKKTVLKLIKE